MNRVCIICLPRSGSQFCVKLIHEHTGSYDLGEFFEGWNFSNFELTENKNIIQTNYVSDLTVPSSINKEYINRLNLLQKADHNQPIVIRLFLMEHYEKDVLTKIVNTLNNINFNFLALKRNVVDQLLSYAIAVSYKKNLKRDIFYINTIADEVVDIDLKHVGGTLIKIHDSIMNYDKNIDILFENKKITKINYESLSDDIKLIYGKNNTYEGNKTVQTNHTNLIRNIEEVRTFFKQNFNIII